MPASHLGGPESIPGFACGAQSGTETGLPPSSSAVHSKFHFAILQCRLHLHVSSTNRKKGRNLRTFQEAMLFRKSEIGEHWAERCFYNFSFFTGTYVGLYGDVF
jgi:hypothetical protein